MSETPYNPGDPDATQRYAPGNPSYTTPPTAPGTPFGGTGPSSPAGPTASAGPTGGGPSSYEPWPAQPPTSGAAGPTSGAPGPTSGAPGPVWGSQPGYPTTPYPQSGAPTAYQAQPIYGQTGYPAGGQVVPAGYPTQPVQGTGYPQYYDAMGRPLSDKSKVVAGVLGIALGGFGAGRFYTGHTGIAVAQLIVTLVTCGLGHFWGLVDGIMILVNGGTDAQGRVLRDS